MSKEIICVYQDCAMCGDKGKKLKAIIKEKKLNVRKVSFASPEGRELIYTALTVHKIGRMPFFTDGERFSNDINDIIKPKTKSKKKGAKK